MQLVSGAFTAGQPIPRKYTGDGQDLSPPLSWTDVPDGTQQFALIVDDPDAPRPEPWLHWLLFQLPATTLELAEGVAPSAKSGLLGGAMQGRNSWGKTGYGGPAPPRGHGVHRYFFRLYALDQTFDLSPDTTKDQLLRALEGHILATAELMGTYQR